MPIRKTIGGFQADLKKFAKQIGVNVDIVTRKVALDIHNGVTLKNPVAPDSGRSRASWQIQRDTPSTRVMPEGYSGGAVGGLRDAQANQSNIQPRPNAPYGVIWVSNALPYVERLEYGWSKQAPQGMVRITLAEVAADVRSRMIES